MAKLHHHLPKNVLIDVYYALFHSHQLYGLLTWGSTYSTLIKNLQTLQNSAMSITERREWKRKVKDVYQKHELLNVKNLYHFEIVKIMFLYHAKKLPLPFENDFTYISQQRNYFTPGVSAGALQLPKFSTSKLQHSFKFQGAKIWNRIPKEIKDLGFSTFKTEFKKKKIIKIILKPSYKYEYTWLRIAASLYQHWMQCACLL